MSLQEGTRILVVEDDPDAATMLRQLLEKKFEAVVDVAVDRASARRSIASSTFDLVLLDYQLPDCTGLELLEEINSADNPPPVIIVTGHGDEDTAARSIQLGVAGYVVKSPDLPSLLPGEVERAITFKRAKEALKESEETYRTLVETSPDDIAVTDLEGRFIKVSSRTLELHGYESEDELLGMNAIDLVAPEDVDAAKKNLEKVLREGVTRNVEYTLLRKDGSRFLSEVNTRLIRDSKGNPKAVMAVVRDITERKRAEEEVREALLRFESVIENTPHVAIQGLDREGIIRHWNSASENLYGFTASEAIGRSFDTLLLPTESTRDFKMTLEETWDTGKPTQPMDWPILTRDGREYWVYSTMFPILERGEVSEVIRMDVDVTGLRQAEESVAGLSRLYSVLSRLNEAIIHIHEPSKLYREACRVAVEEGRLRMAWIGLVAPGSYDVRPVASWGLDEGFLEGIHVSTREKFEGYGPIGTAIREGRYSVCNNIEHDPGVLPWREEGLKRGYRSSAAFPLRKGSQIVGSMNVYSGQPGFFTTEEVKLLEAFADNLSFAMDTMEREEKRKASERLISVQKDLALRLSAAGELSEVLEVALDTILKATGMDSGGIYISDEETGALDLVHHRGISPAFVEEVCHYEKDEPNARQVASGIPVFRPFDEIDELKETAQAQEGLTFIARVPLRQRDRIIGCVNVASHTLQDLPDESREMIEMLTGQISQAITRSRLVQAIKESEEKYRLLYDYAGEAIYTYDKNLNLIGVNRVACEKIGYSEDEILGRNVMELDILHPDDYEKTAKDIQRLFEGEPVVNDELRFISKDGTLFIADVTGATFYDEDGNLAGVTNIALDITERKRAEQALHAEKSFTETILNTMADSLVVFNREGNALRWNRAFNELTGYTDEEIPPMQASEFFLEEEYLAVLDAFADVISTGRTRYVEATVLRKDGSSIFCRLSGAPLRDNNDNIIGVIGTGRDISDLKRDEEELTRINLELEGYAHAVSHDIKGPLSSALGANILLRELLSNPDMAYSHESLKEAMELTSQGLRRALFLTDELLALAEAGQVPEEVTDVDVSQIVQRVLLERAGTIEDRSITVNVGDELGHITANSTHIYQLFSNIIGNAIDHNDSEEPVVSISYLGDDEEGGHRYLISDNGSGIPADDMGNIFMPFAKGRDGDTGIGLSIVDKLIKVYDGKVRAYNDNGACFEFTLKDVT